MRALTYQRKSTLASLLLCTALGACVVPGCGSKIDGNVSTGGDAGGSTAAPGTGGTANGGGGASSAKPSTVVLDVSKLSTGDSNAIATGGYWWTYTDHNPDDSQYHALISPVTARFPC